MTGLRLHLVRHGESTWNAAGLLQGTRSDVPLTRRGLEQARMVALGLRDNPVAAVYSSDQLRSTQTAELVAAWHGVPVRREVALREQCHGAWQGRSARRYGPVLASAELDWAPPGGETARALLARVEEFVAVLLRIPWPAGSHIVLVSHGETIRALLAALDGGPPEAMPRRIPGNGEVRTVSVAVAGVLPVGPTRGLR